MSQTNNSQNTHLSEEEIDEIDEVETPVKNKLSTLEQFNELKEMYTRLETLTNEKFKTLEKDLKDIIVYFKKDSKDIEQFFKKVEKVLKVESTKSTKSRKTGNSGKGGFQELKAVPKKLREYLELDEATLFSRPSVTKMLNQKFKDEGFRSEDNGKVIKITNKKSAKVLGCKVDTEIKFNELQTFIKKYYDEEKALTVSI
jgi:hypothetical protein